MIDYHKKFVELIGDGFGVSIDLILEMQQTRDFVWCIIRD